MENCTDDQIFKIQRNLSDAGCDASLIEQFLLLEKRQDRREQYRLLSRHRASLLEELHQEQYKIDCLDYMVYAMQKKDRKEMEDQTWKKNGTKLFPKAKK